MKRMGGVDFRTARAVSCLSPLEIIECFQCDHRSLHRSLMMLQCGTCTGAHSFNDKISWRRHVPLTPTVGHLSSSMRISAQKQRPDVGDQHCLKQLHLINSAMQLFLY